MRSAGAPPPAPQTPAAPAAAGSGGAPTGYRVYRGTSPGSVTTLVATLGSSQTSWKNSGLAAKVTYYYEVAATNAAGEGPRSNQASATTR